MELAQTHALAAHLATMLCAQPVERLDLPPGRWQANVLLLNCTGQVIQQVRAYGKWLFLDFSHGYTWAVQLVARATVRVSRGKDGNAPADPSLLTFTLRNHVTASLTGHPWFLILPTEGVFKHADLADLGPDPLVTTSFADDFAYRLRHAANRSLGSALLDQGVVAGLGTPLKCEVLHRSRLHPATRVACLLASHVQTLGDSIAFLAARLRAEYSLFYASRATRVMPVAASLPYAVYDRAGEPCPTCRTPIEVTSGRSDAANEGGDSRLTWYCPKCQVLPASPTLFGP